jgi:uncharacterized membrane protein YhfC
MFGLGHGGLEAMLLAGFPLAGVLVTWLLAAHGILHPGPAVDAIRRQTAGLTFWPALVPALERAGAIAFHVGCALIVLRGWTAGQRGWLALAILLHFGVNAVTALLIHSHRVNALSAELVFVALALMVLMWGWRLARPLAVPAPAVLETA